MDGREELTVVQCNATHETQHWKISNGTITSRLFPDRCVDGNPRDLSGVEGGYLLWPKPQYVNLGYDSTALQVRGVTFELSNISSTLIWRAVARYQKLLDLPHLEEMPSQSTGGLTLELVCTGVAQACTDAAPLQEDMDEAYRIDIQRSPPVATVSAAAVWGLLRGLETMSQMIERKNRTLFLRAVPVSVHDFPR